MRSLFSYYLRAQAEHVANHNALQDEMQMQGFYCFDIFLQKSRKCVKLSSHLTQMARVIVSASQLSKISKNILMIGQQKYDVHDL